MPGRRKECELRPFYLSRPPPTSEGKKGVSARASGEKPLHGGTCMGPGSAVAWSSRGRLVTWPPERWGCHGGGKQSTGPPQSSGAGLTPMGPPHLLVCRQVQLGLDFVVKGSQD